MIFKHLTSCALLAVHALSGTAKPVTTSDAEALVSTPYGFVQKSNVHLVPKGARVHHTLSEVQLITADGTILHSAPVNGSPIISAHFGNISGSVPRPTLHKRTVNTGYVAYAYWENTAASPIFQFTTSWTVPPIPTNWDNQILYISNALLPNSFDAILHPTLQFGESDAGGGASWGLVSWFTVGSSVYHSTLVPVEPGQLLTGYIYWESSSTGVGSTSESTWTNFWSTGFYSGFEFDETNLYVSTTEVLSWAYEAMSIFNTGPAGDLPTGTTAMTEINLFTQDFEYPVLGWTAISDPSDAIFMSVDSTSSTSGAVHITYPNP